MHLLYKLDCQRVMSKACYNDKHTFWKDTVVLHINTENTSKCYFEEKHFLNDFQKYFTIIWIANLSTSELYNDPREERLPLEILCLGSSNQKRDVTQAPSLTLPSPLCQTLFAVIP